MEKVSGFVDHIIYRKIENSYTVLLLVTDDQQELVCVGTLPFLDEGECMEAEGEYVEHVSYGHQFKISSFRKILPSDIVSMERYLASGAIKGIKEALARKIVGKFKEDTFRIMEVEPERLAEIKGISERKAREIAEIFMEKRQQRQAFIFLQKYGISNNLSIKIYEEYKDEMYSVMQNNPYKLAEDIKGVGFKTADELASKMGIRKDSQYRIRCAVVYVLMQSSSEGNTYLPYGELIERTTQLLEIDSRNIEDEIPNIEASGKVVIKGEKVYSSVYYYSELACARMLSDLNITMDESLFAKEEKTIRRNLDKVVKEQGITLDPLQKEAVFESIKYGVTIISGGPGTGKTTTINTIIRFFDMEGMDILLAAPTGRAAKRMQETTGYEAKTIHRLLEINGMEREDDTGLVFGRNEENPLEADVIVIDEMSMVDINLFKALLKAVSVGTRLILVGDVDQLPSVGPGQVLKELIESKAFCVVMLEHIFRQAVESDIVLNAHAVNKGLPIKIDNKSKDFFFLKRDNIQHIYQNIVLLIKEKLPSYVDGECEDIQVLTPMRKGPLGVETLNSVLQEKLNPKSKEKEEFYYQDKFFREGDKVMQVKNNYQLVWEIKGYHGITVDEGVGVYNGDMGKILSIDRTAQRMVVRFDDDRQVEYSLSDLDELELAYAVTIHKAQGSEYPAVIIPLLSGPKMLFNRNLLYTAITRARKTVVILGNENTVDEMISNNSQVKRYTSLTERINEVINIEQG